MREAVANSLTSVLHYPEISPFILSIGPLQIRWYSVIYIGGFFIYYLIFRRFSKSGYINIELAKIDDLVLWSFVGVVCGARIFYILFYNLQAYIENPARILMIWMGGLSFHGGLVGVLIAIILFSRKFKLNALRVMDGVSLCAPIALGLGRIGNFLNQELWGRAASPDVPWAMIFPRAGDNLPRHPSQFYEATAEGLLLGLFLWRFKKRNPKDGTLSALFLIGYGVGRFVVEFFREPDEQLGFIFFNLSMGQLLCLAMMLLGAGCLYILNKTRFFARLDYSSEEKSAT